MTKTPNKLKVFLCHASENKPIVQGLYDRLKADGFDPWLDSEFLLPGMNWDLEIQQAMRASDAVIVCLSKISVTKEGFVQKEIKYAQEILKEKPEGTIYLLPVQLEECDLPFSLQAVQWGKYYEAGGYKKIVKSLIIRGKQLNRKLTNFDDTVPEENKRLDKNINVTELITIKTTVQLILDGEIDSFDKRRREDVVGILSKLLNVNKSDIRILEVTQGSIILKIEIPKQSEKTLKAFAENKDIRLSKLGIRSIQVSDEPPIQLTHTNRLPHGEFPNSTVSRKSKGNPPSTAMNPTRDSSSFVRGWKEFWGRRKVIPPIPFPDTSIITQPDTFRVDTPGYYLQLPPMTVAVLIASSGQKMVFTEGGYKDLQAGAYMIQYVDVSERFFTLPKIAASTNDGYEVSLTISITYKVNDPPQITKVANPLQTLFTACEAAVRNFIVTHSYDEIIGKPSNKHVVSDYEIMEHIKKSVMLNQTCRAFWIMDVLIKKRSGRSVASELDEQGFPVLGQHVYEKLALEQDRHLEIQAKGEATQSEVLENAERLRIELEKWRNLPNMQNAQAMQKIKKIEKALQALVQAQINLVFQETWIKISC